MTDRTFRVDLRGVVDVLSHHLYSSPRVYVRELLQNAVDALQARGPAAASGGVLLVPADVAVDGHLHCIDTGVGLTRDEVERFLATIGSSSKRDELGLARSQFLGQFGIGLLSCFLVSDRIELLTRSARGGPAVRWLGSGDGSYIVEELDEQSAARMSAGRPDAALAWRNGDDDIGTWLRLSPLRGSEEWLSAATVTRLATEFGAMLDWPVAVAQSPSTASQRDTGRLRRVTGGPRPWEPLPTDQLGREAARLRLEELLDVRALTTVPLAVPEAGLRGTAVVLGQPAPPSSRGAHRVYVRGMLVGTAVPELLPDWAFFVRCVVDADHLRLTASREALYEDDLTHHVREELGRQLRGWMLRTAEVDPDTFSRFLDLHALAVKSLAAHDDELLVAVLPWLQFETTAGPMTLPEVARQFGFVRYVASVDEFRQIAPVAAAQGLGVVNAGYAYDVQLVGRVPLIDPAVSVEPIAPGDLTAHVRGIPAGTAEVLQPFVTAARRVLDPLGVDVELREFEPISLPGLVLDDRESRHRRASRAAAGDGVWADVLRDLDTVGPVVTDRPTFLLNHANPTVRRVTQIADPVLRRLAVESLYCHALLLGRHPLRPADTDALTRSFVGLLDRAVRS